MPYSIMVKRGLEEFNIVPLEVEFRSCLKYPRCINLEEQEYIEGIILRPMTSKSFLSRGSVCEEIILCSFEITKNRE